MYMTSISLSYLFLAIGVLSLIFLFYFKVIVASTSEHSANKEKIIGNMKDPDDWRNRNNRISYVFLFWSILSLAVFVYLKYYYGTSLISAVYVIAYLALVVISIAIFGLRRKTTS